MNDEIERMLWLWGNWARTSELGGLGYPRQSILGRLQKEGGILGRAVGARPIEVHAEAERVEAIVRRLHQRSPQHEEMVRFRYLSGMSQHEIARKAKMSETRVRVMLREAISWIDGQYDKFRMYVG